jgi:hypothetical protein
LRIALFIAIAVAASNGLGFGRTVVDQGTNARQRQMSMINLVSPAEKTDIGETPNPEGAFRTTDW